MESCTVGGTITFGGTILYRIPYSNLQSPLLCSVGIPYPKSWLSSAARRIDIKNTNSYDLLRTTSSISKIVL